MPHRLIKFAEIDYQMVALNATSVATLIASYVTENATGWAVGFLIVTVGVLNLAKAYSVIKHGKSKNNKKK